MISKTVWLFVLFFSGSVFNASLAQQELHDSIQTVENDSLVNLQLTEAFQEAKVTIYISPNPFSERMLVRLRSNKSGEYILTLSNTDGRSIVSQPGSLISGVERIIPIGEGIVKGTYILTVTWEGKQVYHNRIIKE